MLLQTMTQALVQAAAAQTAPAQTTVVRPSFTETLIESFREAFAMVLGAIPRILAFIIIVAIGWFVSSLLAKGVTGLLRVIRFDELMQRSGLADFMNKMGTGIDSVGIVAGIVKWIVRVVVLLVAFDALGLPAVSDVMRQLLLWLPNLVVAISFSSSAESPRARLATLCAERQPRAGSRIPRRSSTSPARRCGRSRSWLRSTSSESRPI